MTEDRGQMTDENRKVGQPSAAAFSWLALRPALHLPNPGLTLNTEN